MIDEVRRDDYCVMPDGTIEVLLLTTRGTGQWGLPKGAPEKKLKPVELVSKEAWEEAGAFGFIWPKPLGGFLYDKYINSKLFVRCHLQVFPMQVEGQNLEWKEKGQRKLEWMSIDEAILRLHSNTRIPKKKKMATLLKKAKTEIYKRHKIPPRRAQMKDKKLRGNGFAELHAFFASQLGPVI